MVSVKNIYEEKDSLADRIQKRGNYKLSTKLKDTTNNLEAFRVVFEEHAWFNYNGFNIIELQEITHENLSPWYIWMLQTYCLGRGSDDAVQYVIDLHKKVIGGDIVTEKEWEMAYQISYNSYWIVAFPPRGVPCVSAWCATWTIAYSVAEDMNSKDAITTYNVITENLYNHLSSAI